MFREKTSESQQSLWIETGEIAAVPTDPFYRKLNAVFRDHNFGDQVRELCEPFYETEEKRGHPGIDPEVYVKMHLVGFFEGISSMRQIAARCADSISIRAFLHYELTERTPVHSTISKISKRLPLEVHRQCFALVLQMLGEHGLLKGRNLGIDASTIEANAALDGLEQRMSGESYSEYIGKLAAEAGIDPDDEAAVRSFDRSRPGRKTSNKEWKNPHDPDAKVGRTKRGTTRMIYKAEHAVDLDTGAIADADIRPGDEHDTEDLSERVRAIDERIITAMGTENQVSQITSITADKGYFKLQEVINLDDRGYGPVIADPHRNRRRDRLSASECVALERAAMRCEAPSGKRRQRQRSELVERTFAHVLDCGGARRTTLRGLENISKRYLLQTAAANLSLLMRKLIGVGTPRQAIDRLSSALRQYLTLRREFDIAGYDLDVIRAIYQMINHLGVKCQAATFGVGGMRSSYCNPVKSTVS